MELWIYRVENQIPLIGDAGIFIPEASLESRRVGERQSVALGGCYLDVWKLRKGIDDSRVGAF